MASLRPPGLGPIVGATTESTCRIWIRAGDPADRNAVLDENRRTVGVIGLKRDQTITDAWYFRLHREYDRTGTFVLGQDVQLGWHVDDFKRVGQRLPRNPPPEAVPLPLQPDTKYVVRVGTLTIDDPLPNAETLTDRYVLGRLPDINVIKGELLTLDYEASEASFRTFSTSETVANQISFLLGSCRYPGLLWKIKEADRIFAPMMGHFQISEFGNPAHFTIMCGDQIYADMLNRNVPLMRADTYEEFQERYVTAYGGPNLRTLMRNSTTYMILDDHEIEDNWIQDRLHDAGKHQVFNFAIGAYQSYQWSHGPRTFGRHLYYTFECDGYPAFVLDTRTQRLKNHHDRASDKCLRDNHLLGYPSVDRAHPGQLGHLLEWLSQQQKQRGNVPKFIVTSSVFVPNAIDERIDREIDVSSSDGEIDRALFEANQENRDLSDSWSAFPNTRLALLKHIVQGAIQNVVFLAGDIHCSNVAEIDFDGENASALKAFTVTSSAFYWPFPFADGDPNAYVHDSRKDGQHDPFPIPGTGAVMHYRSFGFTQEDNFTRLSLDRKARTLTVRVFDRDGSIVRVTNSNGSMTTANVLKLPRW